MSNLHGVITAIPTPLGKREELDSASLKKIIDHVISRGANGVFVLGNMGEGAALLDDQKLLVVEKSVEYVSGRVPLLAGISDVSPRRMIELGRRVKALGPDFLVFTTPYYYRFPHPDSIYESAALIDSELECPLVFYNCPHSTGNAVDADILFKIMRLKHVMAVKDSSCDFRLFSELLRAFPEKPERPCSILQGDEMLYDMSLLEGADGVVTGGGTVFLETLVDLYEAALKNDRARCFALNRVFTGRMQEMLGPEKMTDWMYSIKLALSEKGLCEANVTSPFLKRGFND